MTGILQAILSFFGVQASSSANYIEDVFSTYLYTGTGSSQTITNNIDTTTYGGLVWIKGRSGATGHRLTDTARGTTKSLASNSADAEATESTGLTAFGTTGFTIGADADYNTNTATYASWTFRKQAKFFDVVTYTGNGTSQNIPHNLGSVPGCILVKSTSLGSVSWRVYHRSLGATKYLILNTTDAATTRSTDWNDTEPTSTQFTVGSASQTNDTAVNYVAYLFAHDAGGFGAAGTDNVISCGSFTSDGSGNATVNLGYEPQWMLLKRTNDVNDWYIADTMRGWTADNWMYLIPNSSAAEAGPATSLKLNSTGFSGASLGVSQTYIYIAIRRGPMKTPTSGTSVFSVGTATGNGVSNTFTTNFPVDLSIDKTTGITGSPWWIDRLRGGSQYITSATTAAEGTNSSALIEFTSNTGIVNKNWGANSSNPVYVDWMFRRAPGFFDVVCYTGTGSGAVQNVTHNLTVVPEMMIVKCRSAAGDSWMVYSASTGNTKYLQLNSTAATATFGLWNNTTPTASVFTVGNDSSVNVLNGTYVAYLFATVTGVSKVGSYTGTGTTKQIDCGFTAGARFVMIKRTDSTGDWYVWDTARGIVSGNDPYLLLNSTAAEVTNTDYVDTSNAGFEISSTAPAAINANGGTYIFLAIA